jgi:hypothetical protein
VRVEDLKGEAGRKGQGKIRGRWVWTSERRRAREQRRDHRKESRDEVGAGRKWEQRRRKSRGEVTSVRTNRWERNSLVGKKRKARAGKGRDETRNQQ